MTAVIRIWAQRRIFVKLTLPTGTPWCTAAGLGYCIAASVCCGHFSFSPPGSDGSPGRLAGWTWRRGRMRYLPGNWWSRLSLRRWCQGLDCPHLGLWYDRKVDESTNTTCIDFVNPFASEAVYTLNKLFALNRLFYNIKQIILYTRKIMVIFLINL